MPPNDFTACIAACEACNAACLQCARACEQEDDRPMLGRCIDLDIECAQACRHALAAMRRGADDAAAHCALAADACDACADECSRHDHDHCQRCAEACRQCAAACRTVTTNQPDAAGVRPQPGQRAQPVQPWR